MPWSQYENKDNWMFASRHDKIPSRIAVSKYWQVYWGVLPIGCRSKFSNECKAFLHMLTEIEQAEDFKPVDANSKIAQSLEVLVWIKLIVLKIIWEHTVSLICISMASVHSWTQSVTPTIYFTSPSCLHRYPNSQQYNFVVSALLQAYPFLDDDGNGFVSTVNSTPSWKIMKLPLLPPPPPPGQLQENNSSEQIDTSISISCMLFLFRAVSFTLTCLPNHILISWY